MRTPRGRARLVACVVVSLIASARVRDAASTPLESVAPVARPLERVGPPAAPDFVVRPVDTGAARAVTVYLHGLCGGPENGCAFFRARMVEDRWLVCPTAPTACMGGGASWTASPRAQSLAIERALTRASRAPGVATAAVDRAAPRVLIGFSQGAYAAMTRVRTEPGRWQAVAFVGAYVSPSRALLEASGVRRVLFAAGRRDETYRTLQAAARRLQAEGFAARFLDLGWVGHTYADHRSAEGWRAALAWLHATTE